MQRLSSLVVLSAVLSACGPAVSIVRFTTWGEAFIEEGIPAASFEDGWSVKFTKFLVIVKEITVTDAANAIGSNQPGAKAFDLVKKGPVEIYASTVPVKTWDVVRFSIAPDANAEASNIEPGDLALLKTRAASLIVIGSATKSGVTKTFEWNFTHNTVYDNCERADGMGKGLVALPGRELTVQLTMHGDHLFYDQLTGDAKLRFDAFANADANNDNKVTLDEVQAVQLTSLPAGQYGTAGAANVRNLRDFMTQNSRSIGHFDGEGECTPRSR